MKHLVVMIFHSRVFAPETKKYVILKLKFPDVFGNCLTSFSSRQPRRWSRSKAIGKSFNRVTFLGECHSTTDIMNRDSKFAVDEESANAENNMKIIKCWPFKQSAPRRRLREKGAKEKKCLTTRLVWYIRRCLRMITPSIMRMWFCSSTLMRNYLLFQQCLQKIAGKR